MPRSTPSTAFGTSTATRRPQSHLRCMSAALADGGLYVLGMHLLPTKGEADDHEEWSARRGNLVINSSMWTEQIDRRPHIRSERLGITFDVFTPTRQFQIRDGMDYRTVHREAVASTTRGFPSSRSSPRTISPTT